MRALLIAIVGLVVAGVAEAEVTIDWVTVDDPGNDCEVQPGTFIYPGGCFGSVGYVYQISKYEVTNAQYAEFLNAVAATDTYGLYNTEMGSGYGGIIQNFFEGSYSYILWVEMINKPVTFVSFYDTLRFANWLHNGQPTGAQDDTTTEDGAYTMITERYPDGPFVTRNADATVFLPSEDEWYKAAYYDALSKGYFDYPASTSTEPTCAAPGATPNTANCWPPLDDLTDVGSYTGSASPYGTFDQGGNVWEWNEAIIDSVRGLRGGSFYTSSHILRAAFRSGGSPWAQDDGLGFRVASVPGPLMEIDIKPRSDTNPINALARGMIPVAILGSDVLDVADVDATTLAFGPDGAAPAHAAGGHVQDVNDDDFMDLLSHYRTQETGIAIGDTEACVTGETFDEVPLEGCDDIITFPNCGIGYELAFLLPPLLWLRQRRRSCSA